MEFLLKGFRVDFIFYFYRKGYVKINFQITYTHFNLQLSCESRTDFRKGKVLKI